MAPSCRVALVLLLLGHSASATVLPDMDYGGVPLWINRLLGEPSVLSLKGRLDPAWFRATNSLTCPQQCDCPVQWPTALYCDHGGLAHIPARLPDRTQYLFLQGNNISSLSSSVLGNITGLRWLILDHNQLEGDGLDRAALQNHTRLRHLFANHNKLSSVPSALPSGLRQLRLAHNRISSIGPGAFQNLRNLTLLLLQGNRLKSIAEGDLKGLVRLNMLDLSRNMFSTVPSHLPPSIQQLYLSNNSLAALSKDSFASLLNLKFLRLSHCGLQSRSVHEQSLNLSSLVELDLSHNRLTAIPTVPTSLQYLYMEANEVQEFNIKSFCREVGPASYSRMKLLRLDGNNMSPQHLPPDWVFCLRMLENMYI